MGLLSYLIIRGNDLDLGFEAPYALPQILAAQLLQNTQQCNQLQCTSEFIPVRVEISISAAGSKRNTLLKNIQQSSIQCGLVQCITVNCNYSNKKKCSGEKQLFENAVQGSSAQWRKVLMQLDQKEVHCSAQK